MKQETTRRGFLVTVGRVAALVGLGALVMRLGGRRDDPSATHSPGDICRRCGALDSCNRPDGITTRQAMRGDALSGMHLDDDLPATDRRGLCGEPPDGQIVSRWVRREET